MCRISRYKKTNPDRAIAGLFHTQKSDENCEIHNFFLLLDFAEALAQFENIIRTMCEFSSVKEKTCRR